MNNETESSNTGNNVDMPVNPECDSNTENSNNASPTVDANASVPSEKLSARSALKEEQAVSIREDNKRSPKCFDKVEVFHVTNFHRLIEPHEVKISDKVVTQTAETVVTPIEKLRRKDQEIADILTEKQEIIADFLQLPRGSFSLDTEVRNGFQLFVIGIIIFKRYLNKLSSCFCIGDHR
ncbi:uncharacterized protein LOC106477107 [Limulus polyphemus]|uniref:Uncharacterized protein LOC106477107 n=1 Tax=Limulus polyphemus TaxID=6850 RepID=A0ABM1C2Q8_LIMPO|nr:uncharacterized protein LOC106477107 [Limulus polyphemus]